MGTLYTGPDASYTIGSGGSVGDVAWVLGGNNGLQSGHYKNDFNMDFPDVLPPYQTPSHRWARHPGGTNYTWVLGNQNYIYTDSAGAKLNTGDTVLVTGRARLYVTGDFIMGGQSSIIIRPGASLELYVGGLNTSITAINNGGNCSSFTYFGLPGNRNLSLSGNSTLLGWHLCPECRLSVERRRQHHARFSRCHRRQEHPDERPFQLSFRRKSAAEGAHSRLPSHLLG